MAGCRSAGRVASSAMVTRCSTTKSLTGKSGSAAIISGRCGKTGKL